MVVVVVVVMMMMSVILTVRYALSLSDATTVLTIRKALMIMRTAINITNA